jgi:hypothetical protein
MEDIVQQRLGSRWDSERTERKLEWAMRIEPQGFAQRSERQSLSVATGKHGVVKRVHGRYSLLRRVPRPDEQSEKRIGADEPVRTSGVRRSAETTREPDPSGDDGAGYPSRAIRMLGVMALPPWQAARWIQAAQVSRIAGCGSDGNRKRENISPNQLVKIINSTFSEYLRCARACANSAPTARDAVYASLLDGVVGCMAVILEAQEA